MSASNLRGGLFAAQLKYWRRKRGLSQLDLSLAADVSARHISFMETGRAGPSEEMVLRLANVLAVPPRDRDALLEAAGYEPLHVEPGEVSVEIRRALEQTMAKLEPYPVVIMDQRYTILDTNRAAATLFGALFGGAGAEPMNLMQALFSALGRTLLPDWERTARAMLSRIHQSFLLRGDPALGQLLVELRDSGELPPDWYEPDFGVGPDLVHMLRLKLPDASLTFTLMFTGFSGSRNASVDELMIETFLPADAATERFCTERLSVRAIG
ncbi:MAG: helix-turn-helix domain-containing protein [Deltaproteobacteria bacterium]|nr:helix-turn-helix domain-containing protein [Deltaproteobacteria bacterium]